MRSVRVHKKNHMARAERFRTSLFIVPSFLGVALFYILPFVVVIYYSLIDNPINQEFVGFANYTGLLKNNAFLLSLKNTGVFSAIVIPLAIIIPLFLAILLMKKIPMQSTFRTVLISPLMVPIASIVLIWEILFHYNGTVNEWLIKLGFDAIDWFKSDYSRIVIVLLYMWKNIGYNMILFMSALANIPSDVLEAAMLDGAGSLRTFFKIKLPFLSSSIFFVGILSLINSFKVFREVYLLTGDYPYDGLYMVQHFMNNMFRKLDYQKLSSGAVIMGIILIIFIGILFVIDEKLGRDIEE